MSIIFFNKPLGTPKVQFVNTDKSVSELVALGVIPDGAATLTKPTPADTDMEGLAELAHVDKLMFDSLDNPTAVSFDMELVDLWWKEVYRACRMERLAELDVLQTRALVKGLTSVVSDIETDKQALRDMPLNVDHTTAKTFYETVSVDPVELFVDYTEKYRAALA